MPAHLQASLQSALRALSPAEGQATDFRASHLALLETLGYTSDKTHAIPAADPAAFAAWLESHGQSLNRSKALFAEWTRADLLFQLNGTANSLP